jgi:hydrogenase maturation protease
VTRRRAIGIGQAAAGDDAAGLAVLAALAALGPPPGVELLPATDAAALIPLLETRAHVLIIDAMLGPPPGEVRVVAFDELSAAPFAPLSTHALGVVQAVELARRLYAAGVSPAIGFLGVAIARPPRWREGLSPEVAAAVPRAAALARTMLAAAP